MDTDAPEALWPVGKYLGSGRLLCLDGLYTAGMGHGRFSRRL
jgi:hypothetical protein